MIKIYYTTEEQQTFQSAAHMIQFSQTLRLYRLVADKLMQF